jgi:lambda family phage minor tail protein L
MTIAQDVLKTTVPTYVELFKIDLSTTNEVSLAGTTVYMTPTTSSDGESVTATNVVFGGNTYIAYPIMIDSISFASDGAPPRPKLSIANISKYIGQLAFAYGDIIGATVTYIRTFDTYTGGAGSISLPPLKYFIARKLSHNKNVLSFELRDFRDKERAFLPKRQMLKKDFPGLGINKYVN